ncbi:MAG: hypothetical protein QNJ14_06935 [Woeseiaceae bacterium]|nr:hypothetical protein [Woeseiaceae bacterium]
MSNLENSDKPSWITGVLVGGSLGGGLGVVYLLDELSLLGVLSAAAAGAVFYGALGALGRFLSNPAILFVASGIFGAVAGLAWAAIRSEAVVGPVTYGFILGLAVAAFEGRVFSSSSDEH